MDRGKKSKVSLMQTASAFVKKMNWLQKVTLSGGSLYFVYLSVKNLRLINQYYSSPEDNWRVVFASVSLGLCLLIIIAPFIAVFYIKRKLEAQKKAI
ncbi:MAG: hypothetical protein ACJAZV_001963 [Roseivirga sp.]|jgi:hypothetical protein